MQCAGFQKERFQQIRSQEIGNASFSNSNTGAVIGFPTNPIADDRQQFGDSREERNFRFPTNPIADDRQPVFYQMRADRQPLTFPTNPIADDRQPRHRPILRQLSPALKFPTNPIADDRQPPTTTINNHGNTGGSFQQIRSQMIGNITQHGQVNQANQ